VAALAALVYLDSAVNDSLRSSPPRRLSFSGGSRAALHALPRVHNRRELTHSVWTPLVGDYGAPPAHWKPGSCRDDADPPSLPRAGLPANHDLDVLVECRQQVHQAFDGETRQLVVAERRNLRLRDLCSAIIVQGGRGRALSHAEACHNRRAGFVASSSPEVAVNSRSVGIFAITGGPETFIEVTLARPLAECRICGSPLSEVVGTVCFQG
jgi:hypothetical protein